MAGTDLIVEMCQSNVGGGERLTTLRLTPRHRGWTAHSLMWVSIAAVVRLPKLDGELESIAIVMARLDRAVPLES